MGWPEILEIGVEYKFTLSNKTGNYMNFAASVEGIKDGIITARGNTGTLIHFDNRDVRVAKESDNQGAPHGTQR